MMIQRSSVGRSTRLIATTTILMTTGCGGAAPDTEPIPVEWDPCSGVDREAWLAEGVTEDRREEIVASEEYAREVIGDPALFCQYLDEEKATCAAEACLIHESVASEVVTDRDLASLRPTPRPAGTGTTLAHWAVALHEKVALAALDDLFVASLMVPPDSEKASGLTVAHMAVAAHESAALKAIADPRIRILLVSSQAPPETAGTPVASIAVIAHESAALAALADPLVRTEVGDCEPGLALGCLSVAHQAVIHHEKAALVAVGDLDIASIRVEDEDASTRGMTVAHFAVMLHEKAALAALDDPQVYGLATPPDAPEDPGYTVAHTAVGEHESAAARAVEDPDIAGLATPTGLTVEALARKTWPSLNAAPVSL